MSIHDSLGPRDDYRPLEELAEDDSSPLAIEWLLVVIFAVLPLVFGIFMGINIVGAYFRRILEVVVQPFG